MEIREKVLYALKWGALLKIISQIVTWSATIYVIRLLTPEDYGVMAIATVFVGFAFMINELGLGAAIVQDKNLNEETLRKTYSFILIVNLVLFLLLFFSAEYISIFFDEPRLTLVIQVLSVQFIILAFELIPVALLERELAIKEKSFIQLVAQVSSAMVSLVLAYSGYGVWALVWGSMADAVVRTIGSNIVRPYLKLPSFDFSGMKKIMSFGGYVAGERGVWFFYNEADIFVIGKLLGSSLLGVYAVAMHLSALIMHKTGELIYTISFPAFARIQDEPEKVEKYLFKAVRTMSLLVFPVFIGMSAVADEMVTVLLGENWLAAIPILQILCLVMPLRLMSNLFQPLLQGLGRPGVSLSNLIIVAIIMVIAFVIGAQFGLIGVSLSWLIAFPIAFYISLHRTAKVVKFSAWGVLKEMAWPLMASAVMYASVWIARDVLVSADMLYIWRLLILVSVGGLVYGSMLYLTNRAGYMELIDLVKKRDLTDD